MTGSIWKAGRIGLTGAAVLGGCGGGNGGGGTGSNPVVTVAKDPAQSGDLQTAVVKTAVPESLRVLVKEDGVPKAGVTVSWSTAVTGASVSPASVVTDVAGLAATRFSLGNAAGSQTAQAAVAGGTGSPVSFSATATHGVAAAFTSVSGSGQTTIISTAFPQALVTSVADQFGNPISGVTVDWAVLNGDLLVAAPTSVTNNLGRASIAASGGPTAGAGVVRATTTAVPGTNVDFTLTLATPPQTAAVHASGISYVSNRNLTSNPAVDTIAVGGTVTWSSLGALGTHRVRSVGAPSFTSQAANADTYQITFNAAGSYDYDCAVHLSAMTGTIVVR